MREKREEKKKRTELWICSGYGVLQASCECPWRKGFRVAWNLNARFSPFYVFNRRTAFAFDKTWYAS
jgi:hypothetical protein